MNIPYGSSKGYEMVSDKYGGQKRKEQLRIYLCAGEYLCAGIKC
jgi:hypothetical protein